MNALCQLAAEDERIVLLTGDLGYMAMEPFRERFPDRFMNAGVAEQNMVGMAAGMAEAGLRPYAYSIAAFASLRPFEFIRNGPVLHNFPVRIVGMGMGFDYGHAGPTHYAVEDIAVLRTLPGLTIVAPADSDQAAAAILATASLPGPVYYSLSKDDRLTVPGLDGRFELGRLQIVRRGEHLLIVSMGSISAEALAAADRLAEEDVECTVAILSNFHPDPAEDLAELLSEFRLVISVEAQTASGGLGAFVSSVIATRGIGCRLRSLAVDRSPDGTSGSQMDRWRKHGLDRNSIVEHAIDLVGAVQV